MKTKLLENRLKQLQCVEKMLIDLSTYSTKSSKRCLGLQDFEILSLITQEISSYLHCIGEQIKHYGEILELVNETENDN